MHLVHTKVGLDESSLGYTSDSIVVISVLIEVRKSDQLIVHFLYYLISDSLIIQTTC